MKRTVKSCYKCMKLFVMNSNTDYGKFCKNCSSEIQKKSESKLSEYLELKYNN